MPASWAPTRWVGESGVISAGQAASSATSRRKQLVVLGVGEDRRVRLVVGPVRRLDLAGELGMARRGRGLVERGRLLDQGGIDGQAVEPERGLVGLPLRVRRSSSQGYGIPDGSRPDRGLAWRDGQPTLLASFMPVGPVSRPLLPIFRCGDADRIDDEWTRKDVLAHLEAWERRVVDLMAASDRRPS